MTSGDQVAMMLFKDHLSKKEPIRWASGPLQGLKLKTSDKYMIPFSILWCATVLIWEWFMLGMGESGNTMAWFGVPFLLVGMYLLIGRLFMDAFIRKHTFYAMTPKKLLVKTGKWNRSIDQIPVHKIGRVTVESGKSGNGTLRCYDGHNVLVLQMEMIPDIQHVAELLETTKNFSK